MPLLLSGEPPDEDLVLEWKKEHFGEEEAEEAHAEQKALRDALQAEEASLEAQKRGIDVETYQVKGKPRNNKRRRTPSRGSRSTGR